MFHNISKVLVYLSLISLSCCELVPRTYISYASKPGEKYNGPTENVVVSDLGGDVSGTVAEQVCSNHCNLADSCGAFYVQGSKCHTVLESDKLKTISVGMYFQPPNYFVKESSVNVPLRADSESGTTTTLSNDDITTTTSSNNAAPENAAPDDDAPDNAAPVTTTTTTNNDPAVTTTSAATTTTTTEALPECSTVKLKAQGACVDFTMPGNGPPGMGDGCRIQMKINPEGEVNWQLKIQAMSMGVPSKIRAVKVFDDAGVELTDVVVTNSDEPPESIITRAGQKETNLKAFVELYGTEENPTNLLIDHIQWGKNDDDNMISCGGGK